MLFVQTMYRSLAGKCRMSLLFTVDSVAIFLFFLFLHRSSRLPPFINTCLGGVHYIRWRNPYHENTRGLSCFASFATERHWPGPSLAITRPQISPHIVMLFPRQAKSADHLKGWGDSVGLHRLPRIVLGDSPLCTLNCIMVPFQF
jgi:hypothetical protein